MADRLDAPATRTKLDPTGMLDWVEQFPEQCQQGSLIAHAAVLPRFRAINNVVVCGMGGSAIGGDLLRAYALPVGAKPIEVIRGYTLPCYVDKKTLVVASSYSGNTEETLSAYAEAKKRGAQILAITTGGKLLNACNRDGYPVVQTPGGLSPRAALGYSLFPLLVCMMRVGVIPDQDKSIKAALRTLKTCVNSFGWSTALSANPAKKLAHVLMGTIPVVYAGSEEFSPIANRWACQINENAKVFAHMNTVPEMNHNEILGWKNPRQTLSKQHVVYLMDKGYHKQVKKRFSVMKPIIAEYAHGISEVQSLGTDRLARMMSLISLGDFVSVYLAYLYREDPVPIPAIDLLKAELARQGIRGRARVPEPFVAREG